MAESRAPEPALVTLGASAVAVPQPWRDGDGISSEKIIKRVRLKLSAVCACGIGLPHRV